MRWLLDSDPGIRWQALRDLVQADESAVADERARVATEGWGARILDSQSSHGHWGRDEDRGWMTTIHTLTLLKDLGADPRSARVRLAVDRVCRHLLWHQLDGRPYFDGETEPCINGRILATGAYFGEPSQRLLERLLGEQLPDGGWNCEAPPSRCSSFHSTICVLEGLLEYERACGRSPRLTRARTRAEEYLLARQMFLSMRTGKVIARSFTRFQFPPSYHYDVLRGLDYLRSARYPPDERTSQAIDIVKKRRHQNGLWPLNRIDPRRFTLDMETGVGKRSYWNTLRALRVLKWHAEGTAAAGCTPAG